MGTKRSSIPGIPASVAGAAAAASGFFLRPNSAPAICAPSAVGDAVDAEDDVFDDDALLPDSSDLSLHAAPPKPNAKLDLTGYPFTSRICSITLLHAP